MRDLSARINRMYADIGATLATPGASLRCETCGDTMDLTPARAASFTRHGWPKCCGMTMRIVTIHIEEEEAHNNDRQTTATQ